MSDKDLLTSLIENIVSALAPLRAAAQSTEGLVELFRNIGYDIKTEFSDSQVESIRAAITTASSDLGNETSGSLIILKKVLQLVRSLQDSELGSIADNLFNALLISYLQRESPNAHNFLVMLGIIEGKFVNPPQSSFPHIFWTIHWGNIPELIVNPGKVFEKIYFTDQREINYERLFINLRNLLWTLNISSGIQENDQDLALTLKGSRSPLLRIPILTLTKNENLLEAGSVLTPWHEENSDLFDGLALVPFGMTDVEEHNKSLNGWNIKWSGNASSFSGYGITFSRKDGLNIGSLGDPKPFNINASLIVIVEKQNEGNQRLTIFGSARDSSLSASEFGIRTGLDFKGGGHRELFIEQFIRDAYLVLRVGQDDGFLKSLLPEDGLSTAFDFAFGWSSLVGLYFRGSSSIEVTIPVHTTLGIIKIHSVYLGIKTQNTNEISFFLGASFMGEIGPVSVSIERVGAKAGIKFPSDDTNVGKISLLDPGLLSPTGIGLTVEAGGITGGGFLAFEKPDYSGALQLRFEKIGLAAIGLITTGGPQGFSMVLNIGVEFTPPIQLSFGFQLSGVGGLIAIKRTMRTSALQAGVADGSLESLMFPSDPVANAPVLISQLKTILPPKDDRYVFGPMVRITWGANSLVKGDVGIFLELPQPIRVFLVGNLEGTFPREDKPLVVVKVIVLGLIDMGKKILSIDARLYDSRIMSYNLSGDMALRLSWGNKPYFLMALGGFHPDFSVPSVTPPFLSPMRRLRLDLGAGDNLRLSCETYLALTTNTLQFGARVDLYAKAGPARVEGRLGFNTIITFSPFSFVTDGEASVRVKVKGRNLAGLNLEFMISGPTPWRVRAKVKVKLLVFKKTVRIEKEWGSKSRERLAAQDPLDDLLKALSERQNWGSVLPTDRPAMASLLPPTMPAADSANADDMTIPLVLHPHGTLEIRQSVVPLGLRLAKYQHAPITGHDAFEIAQITVGNQPFLPKPQEEEANLSDEASTFSPSYEPFARCQYFACSRREKLSAPSFEEMEAGAALTSQSIHVPALDEFLEETSLDYESILIDRDRPGEIERRHGRVITGTKEQLVKGNSLTRSWYRRDPALRYHELQRAPAVQMNPETFRIVRATTWEPLPEEELRARRFRTRGPLSRAEADSVLDAFEKAHPEQSGEYHVVSTLEELV